MLQGGVMQGPAPGMMMMPVPGAGPLGPFVQVPIGSDGGGGGGNGPSPNQPMMMMAAPGSGGATRGKNYTDLDQAGGGRVVLDYGDI
jgi:hypothetical protein